MVGIRPHDSAHPPLPWAFDLFFFFFSFPHPILDRIPSNPNPPPSILKGNRKKKGRPRACVIWLKLLWFPQRKVWQSPQCWLVLRAVSCSYLPSWQQVVQAGRQAGWSWLAVETRQGKADLREIEILWWKPGVNKAVTVGVHRKLLSKLAGAWAERVSICVCPNMHCECLCVQGLIGFMSEDSFSQ